MVAVLAASIEPGDLVLEPSAGTGMLDIHAEVAGAGLFLNELADALGRQDSYSDHDGFAVLILVEDRRTAPAGVTLGVKAGIEALRPPFAPVIRSLRMSPPETMWTGKRQDVRRHEPGEVLVDGLGLPACIGETAPSGMGPISP